MGHVDVRNPVFDRRIGECLNDRQSGWHRAIMRRKKDMRPVIRFRHARNIQQVGRNLRLNTEDAVEACCIEGIPDRAVGRTGPRVIGKIVKCRFIHDPPGQLVVLIDLLIHAELIIKLSCFPRSLVNVIVEAIRSVIRQRNIGIQQRHRNRIQTCWIDGRGVRKAVGPSF